MRKRYVLKDGELVEVSDDHVAGRGTSTDAILWNDRIYQDSNDPRFKSRTQHREYMKQNGLTTVDDFKETFKQNAKDRIDARNGENRKMRAEVKQDVVETLRRLDATRRR